MPTACTRACCSAPDASTSPRHSGQIFIRSVRADRPAAALPFLCAAAGAPPGLGELPAGPTGPRWRAAYGWPPATRCGHRASGTRAASRSRLHVGWSAGAARCGRRQCWCSPRDRSSCVRHDSSLMEVRALRCLGHVPRSVRSLGDFPAVGQRCATVGAVPGPPPGRDRTSLSAGRRVTPGSVVDCERYVVHRRTALGVVRRRSSNWSRWWPDRIGAPPGPAGAARSSAACRPPRAAGPG